MKLHTLNGPNLNLLGGREPSLYGNETLSDIEKQIKLTAGSSFPLFFCQSNSEGELINYIHTLKKTEDLLILNAGAYTHTSIALRDALLATGVEFIEVHISNVYKRENFRHKSYLSDIAAGVIAGLGTMGYTLAVKYFLQKYS